MNVTKQKEEKNKQKHTLSDHRPQSGLVNTRVYEPSVVVSPWRINAVCAADSVCDE